MQSTLESEARGRRIARAIETKKDLAELQGHLKGVVESSAFRGSQRSAQFLKYICEQAIAGHLDNLKERAIGVELFRRHPSYDTGEDAIVRVTASDVRKRLSHYYLSAPESSSDLRVILPVGSYVPEFTRDIRDAVEVVEPISLEVPLTASAKVETNVEPLVQPRRVRSPWITIVVCLVILILGLWSVLKRPFVQLVFPRAPVLPWSVFFAEKHIPLLITSDPNIAEIQGLTGEVVSVSDYANQQYVPNASSLSPEILHICRDVLRGDKAASVDTPIVAAVAGLAAEIGTKINVRAARDLRFSDLDSDGNLIFLGSPRTDPWTSLFDDQLDFRFLYENASRLEIIQNVRPHPGEPTEYVPSAKGFATGQSFATLSFVRNPNHVGSVLILAGANAEGTKVAGELATNPPSLAAALQRCGIHSSSSAADDAQHFQILLHLRMMAGSPTAFDIAACHVLP